MCGFEISRQIHWFKCNLAFPNEEPWYVVSDIVALLGELVAFADNNKYFIFKFFSQLGGGGGEWIGFCSFCLYVK